MANRKTVEVIYRYLSSTGTVFSALVLVPTTVPVR
jgi:hypothetical protein